MNRREIIKLVASRTAVIALPVDAAMAVRAEAESAGSTVALRNAHFELSLTSGKRLHCRLIHRGTAATGMTIRHRFAVDPANPWIEGEFALPFFPSLRYARHP